MNDYNEDFWNALDELANTSEIVIDRPKGSAHPRFPDFIYRVDYTKVDIGIVACHFGVAPGKKVLH